MSDKEQKIRELCLRWLTESPETPSEDNRDSLGLIKLGYALGSLYKVNLAQEILTILDEP